MKSDIRDNQGRTPLNLAVVYGHHETVKVLIAEGADINEQPVDGGWSPLHHAVRLSIKDVAKTLLAAGAKVNIKDKREKTPLTIANNYGNAELAELLRQHGARE